MEAMTRTLSFRITLSVLSLLLVNGCQYSNGTLPEKQLSSITKTAKLAPLIHYLKRTDKSVGNRSAFHPLSIPGDAFSARLFLVDHATTSLDVQYYIYEDDLAGKIFSAHLLKAAQRGVKVRILLDDISTAGKDHALALLAYHPNIELRLFNPNRLRRAFRNFALLLDINTLGRRMHNKMLVADGIAAIIGGRNIGDVYFSTLQGTLFLDYDILCTGSIVPELYHAFDLYWNNHQSVPSSEILSSSNTETQYQNMVKTLDHVLNTFAQSQLGKKLSQTPFNKKIANRKLTLTVAERDDLYYDHPDKIVTPESNTTYHISSQVDKELEQVHHDIIIISPYFIPSDLMLAEIREMRTRNIKVTVVTNSLASTDVFPVYSGYKGAVKELLEMGVILYELKPHSLKPYIDKKKLPKAFHTSLHTKMIIIDNHRLIVGSANLDPRSDKLNTEIVLFITSEKLAYQQRQEVEQVINLHHFYKLSWEKHPADEEGRIYKGPVWRSIENGREKVYYYPPKATLWKRLGADILSLLPIKGYL